MAIKDVEQYYQSMCEQYVELQNEIKDFEKEAAENMLPPEKLEDLKKSIDPFLVNWRRITYFMYLLHKPKRKEKEARYKSQNKKLLKDVGEGNSGAAVLEENRAVLEGVKNV